MRLFEKGITAIIILGGWCFLYLKATDIAVNCFLSVYIVTFLKDQK